MPRSDPPLPWADPGPVVTRPGVRCAARAPTGWLLAAQAAVLALAATVRGVAFGFCLGCELHTFLLRLSHRSSTNRQGATA